MARQRLPNTQHPAPSTKRRPQAWAYLRKVASEGERLPVASERSSRAIAGACVFLIKLWRITPLADQGAEEGPGHAFLALQAKLKETIANGFAVRITKIWAQRGAKAAVAHGRPCRQAQGAANPASAHAARA